MNIGDTIQVNNGEIETLIKIERPFGLFKSASHQVVRSLLSIKDKEKVSTKPLCTSLKHRLIREQMILNEKVGTYNSERMKRIKSILKIRYELF